MKYLKSFVLFLVIISLASCGTKSGSDKDKRDDINSGPTSLYFYYSAHDGNDYEIYLLKTDLENDLKEDSEDSKSILNSDGSSIDTAVKSKSKTSDTDKKNEIIQLTKNDTNDIAPSIRGTSLAFACDDNAGSELCVIDAFNNSFKQVSKIENGGLLGLTVSKPSVYLVKDGQFVIAKTDPDGRGNRNPSIISYDLFEDKTFTINIKEKLKLDDFADINSSISTIKKDGNGLLSMSSDNGETGQTYFFNSTDNFKKMGFSTIENWFPNDIVITKDLDDNKSLLQIDYGSGKTKVIKEFGNIDKIDYCSNLNEKSEPTKIVFRSLAVNTSTCEGDYCNLNVESNVFIYDVKKNEIKNLLKENYMQYDFDYYDSKWRNYCYLDPDNKKIVLQRNNSTIPNISVIDIESASIKEIYSPVKEDGVSKTMTMLDVSRDFTQILLSETRREYCDYYDECPPETKELLIYNLDTNKLDSLLNYTGYSAELINSDKSLFIYNQDSLLIYDIEKKSSKTLDYDLYYADKEYNYLVLYKINDCPSTIGWCYLEDNRGKVSFAIYDIKNDKMINIVENGKTITGFSSIELTDKQYELWKRWSKKPSTPVIKDISRLSINVSNPTTINTPYISILSRTDSDSITARFELNDQTTDIELLDQDAEDMYTRLNDFGYRMGFWPTMFVNNPTNQQTDYSLYGDVDINNYISDELQSIGANANSIINVIAKNSKSEAKETFKIDSTAKRSSDYIQPDIDETNYPPIITQPENYQTFSCTTNSNCEIIVKAEDRDSNFLWWQITDDANLVEAPANSSSINRFMSNEQKIKIKTYNTIQTQPLIIHIYDDINTQTANKSSITIRVNVNAEEPENSPPEIKVYSETNVQLNNGATVCCYSYPRNICHVKIKATDINSTDKLTIKSSPENICHDGLTDTDDNKMKCILNVTPTTLKNINFIVEDDKGEKSQTSIVLKGEDRCNSDQQRAWDLYPRP